MAYTVNWTTKVIFIPVSDMTDLGGGEYNLNMSDFHKEIRRLEWEFTEGLAWEQVLDHTNPKTIAGIVYAPFDEIINGYTITFDPTAARVNLLGSNNNLVDVMNVNGVTVVPTNSAGLQIVSVGSGLSNQENAWLEELHRAHFNKRTLEDGKTKMKIYAPDLVTVLHEFDVLPDGTLVSPV